MTCSACIWNRQGGLTIAADIKRRQEFVGTTLTCKPGCAAGDLLNVLRQHVGSVPAAAAIFQPHPEDLPQLLPALLRDAESILARGAAQACLAHARLTLWKRRLPACRCRRATLC